MPIHIYPSLKDYLFLASICFSEDEICGRELGLQSDLAYKHLRLGGKVKAPEIEACNNQ